MDTLQEKTPLHKTMSRKGEKGKKETWNKKCESRRFYLCVTLRFLFFFLLNPASERPMAIACLGFETCWPLPPDLRVPRLNSSITVATLVFGLSFFLFFAPSPGRSACFIADFECGMSNPSFLCPYLWASFYRSSFSLHLLWHYWAVEESRNHSLNWWSEGLGWVFCWASLGVLSIAYAILVAFLFIRIIPGMMTS